MTEPTPVAQTGAQSGAPANDEMTWHAIDWRKANQTVRRLQMRIVKATQAGRWGKVKALQHLLTHSFSGKALAVKRVTENSGKRTPGVDRVLWNTPEKKMAAIHTLRQRGYHPQPLRRVYIPKANGKLRSLGIPCMQDRGMQALYLLALDPIAETTADPNSYGFRKERCPADAIEQCFTVLAPNRAARWIFEGDITACFDEISHDWLLAHIPMDTTMLKKWLKAGYMEKHILHPTEEGTPQGGLISPVIANMALDGLERLLREKYPRQGTGSWHGGKAKVNFIRFADDFVITGASKDLLEQDIQPAVAQFLCERGLRLSQEKTSITPIEEGFDFLGQTIRKYHGVLLITPAKKKVNAFLEKVRAAIKSRPTITAGDLILTVNPLIRGWVNYHRHVVSKRTFCAIDHAIFQAIWRWAKRRHPHKSRHWIREKYFRTIAGRAWRFVGRTADRKGEMHEVRLLLAGKIPIQRHVKIQAHANPYDPIWEPYLESRRGKTMAATLKGRGDLLALWRDQNGKCPLCHQAITKMTGWHNHHIIWRTHGGGDEQANRVLLHPQCHQQVHLHGSTVVKPRPIRGVRKA